MEAFLHPLQGLAEFGEIKKRCGANCGILNVSGCMESQKVHLMYGLSGLFPYHLILADDERNAKEIYEDYRFYDKNVYFYPAKDLLFFQADIHGNLLIRQRMRVIRALLEQEEVTVVTSIDGCMDFLMPLEKIRSRLLHFKSDSVIDLDQLKEELVELGYERTGQVELPGQFSVRGGIIDIYPLTEDNPWRIELWDDEVDSIRSFDAESQRSLENVDENGRLESKADMFTKRTIRPERAVTSVDTPAEALAISIGERGGVDLPYMSELLGTPGEYEKIQQELHGVIFKDPMTKGGEETGWVTADEYLSGNVREKLRVAELAAASDPAFTVNTEYLRKAQPKDLDASEIDVRLGATWVNRGYIQQFMEETFEPPFYLRRNIEVKFSPMTAEWQITGKSTPSRNDVHAYMTYGTSRANAYRILEDTLNLRDIRIYDTVEDADGKQKRVLNKKETTLAQQKQQAIKDAFQNWVWKDPYRRADLVEKYNELFNSTRPREYDGSHIRFGGMNPEIRLREHQQNAIAHVLYGGNTLLAHEVGAGKTFEMAASAMEAKRLGLCQKSMFVVPNHLTLQWANEFLRLYPSAKLLVASKKDFETARRKKFCARIATGDYDAVIIGHSQFEKIPVSAERQERILTAQIDEIENAIAEMKSQNGERFSIKQMEKTRKGLEARLEKLRATDRKDDVITFEQLGVDRLFVDEAHAFKNLFLYTKMRNVAGLSTSEAQKSSDMFMKCQYMDELTGGRGIIFATGTPVSNSMTVRP